MLISVYICSIFMTEIKTDSGSTIMLTCFCLHTLVKKKIRCTTGLTLFFSISLNSGMLISACSRSVSALQPFKLLPAVLIQALFYCLEYQCFLFSTRSHVSLSAAKAIWQVALLLSLLLPVLMEGDPLIRTEFAVS